jgi:MATE family multidrug resistance protein
MRLATLLLGGSVADPSPRPPPAQQRLTTFMGQGVPNALSSLFEQAQLVVMTLMVAQFGKEALGAHSAMMNCFDMASAVIYGTMEAGSMSVAKELGAGRPESARALGKYLLATMFFFGVIIAAAFLAGRNYVGYIFSNEPQVIHDMSQISVLIGVCYVFVCVTFAAFSVIQGQARAPEAMVCFFIGLWIVGTPSAYVIAFPLKQGFLGVWEGCVLGYLTMTLLMVLLVGRSDWTKLSEAARERSEVAPLLARRSSSSLGRSSPYLRVASASPA